MNIEIIRYPAGIETMSDKDREEFVAQLKEVFESSLGIETRYRDKTQTHNSLFLKVGKEKAGKARQLIYRWICELLLDIPILVDKPEISRSDVYSVKLSVEGTVFECVFPTTTDFVPKENYYTFEFCFNHCIPNCQESSQNNNVKGLLK